MKVYLIEECVGFGLYESPYQYRSTGLVFINKESAEKRANEEWIKNVPEKERKDTWCGTHYIVKELELL